MTSFISTFAFYFYFFSHDTTRGRVVTPTE